MKVVRLPYGYNLRVCDFKVELSVNWSLYFFCSVIYINGLGGYLTALVVVGIAASCRDEMYGMETGFDLT